MRNNYLTLADVRDKLRKRVDSYATQRQAADALGVSYPALNKMLQERQLPTAEICDALGVTPSLVYLTKRSPK